MPERRSRWVSDVGSEIMISFSMECSRVTVENSTTGLKIAKKHPRLADLCPFRRSWKFPSRLFVPPNGNGKNYGRCPRRLEPPKVNRQVVTFNSSYEMSAFLTTSRCLNFLIRIISWPKNTIFHIVPANLIPTWLLLESKGGDPLTGATNNGDSIGLCCY